MWDHLWHQEDAFSGRVGDGVLGSLGEMQPGSMCCLFLVPELPRIPSFFTTPVLGAACHDLILSCLLQISPGCLSVISSTQFRVTFRRVLAVSQPSMEYPCLLIAFVGSGQILFGPSMLLCKHQQASSKMSFKKPFPK